FTAAAITHFSAAWYGFAVLRARPERIDAAYWAAAPIEGGWRLELAGEHMPRSWGTFVASLLGRGGETLSFHDDALGRRRFARFDGDRRLMGALFVDREPVAAARDWIAERLDAPFGSAAERLRILSGRPGA